MLFLFLIAIPALVIFLLKNCIKLVGVKAHNHPPGPPGLPLIGNLYQLDKESLHKYLWQLSKKYGPLMFMKLGFSKVVVISSAKIAKEAMKTHDITFSGKPSFLGQQKLSYNGLDVSFSSYGDYWREIRKICVIHLFNTKKVQSFRPIRADEVSRMVNHVTELASTSKLVNLSEIILSLSSSIICRVGFGKRYDEKGDEKKRFHKLLREAEAVLGDFFVSDFFPIFGWVDKVNGKGARLEKIYNELDLFYQQLIEEHLSPTRPKSMDGDILDTLIVLRHQTLSSSLILTWDHIKAVLMDVFIAGTDTTAAAVVWGMTALMKEPKAMKKLQENIRELVGKKGRVDEDDIQKLPYLKAVIKETLRLYPPAPLLVPRKTIQKCMVNDGYEIQPNTLVFFNAWAIGRDPECWKNPEDFIPERFCSSSVTNEDIDIDYKSVEFEMIPFGGGRRGCPGISLGVATVELALANLLYAFDWELPFGMVKQDIDTNTLPGLTTHKKNPLCLVAKLYH